MRRLHIAFFNRSFYPDTAATGQLLTELAEGLVRDHGCRVSVVAGVPLLPGDGRVTGRRQGWPFAVERYGGIEILRAQGTRFSKKRFAGRFSNYISYSLSACYAGLRLDRPDIVVGLTDPPIIGLAAFAASRRFGAPLVMSYRDLYPEAGRLLEDFQSDLVDAVLDRVTRFLASRADRVVALGETMRQRLIEEKGADLTRTMVIPDWADCSAIVPGPKRNAFSVEHGLADRFVVLHSGNIGLSQGLESLVEAAHILRDVPEILFVFVGDGVKRQALEDQVCALALSNVRFLPFQPKQRLAESYASADVFVVSLKRGLAGTIVPSKLYGILAAGRPYVAAVDEECEITEYTRKYECGVLAEPGNPKDLADKIMKLFREGALRKRLATNAREAGLAFDRPIHVRAYYELFRDLAGTRQEGW